MLGVGVLAACGNGTSTDHAESNEHDPAVQTQGASASEEREASGAPTSSVSTEAPAPGDACERALACCPAYLEVLPEPQRREANEACVTLTLAVGLEGRARDEACQGAREGFRSRLTELGIELPDACR